MPPKRVHAQSDFNAAPVGLIFTMNNKFCVVVGHDTAYDITQEPTKLPHQFWVKQDVKYIYMTSQVVEDSSVYGRYADKVETAIELHKAEEEAKLKLEKAEQQKLKEEKKRKRKEEKEYKRSVKRQKT